MTTKHLCILLVALVAVIGTVAQSDDIPIENDNQFPLENPAQQPAGDTIEGSGDGTVAETSAAPAETTPLPQLEEVQSTDALVQSAVAQTDDQSCPVSCVCHYEEDSFVVDCSGYGLTEFPSPIDAKTTILNLQDNKLTEIPKDISLLKNLKILNAGNNMIKELALGSISELPELTVLKLGNNRLLDYPKDLKNSLSLTKLEELDLGGNDMRGELKPEILSNLKSLRKLTLATTTTELLQDLCNMGALELVCTGSCNEQMFECLETPLPLTDEFLINATLPGTVPLDQEDSDPDIKSANTENSNVNSEGTPDEALVTSFTGSNMTETGTLLDNAGQEQINNAGVNSTNSESPSNNLDSGKEDTPAEAPVNNLTKGVKLLDNAGKQQANDSDVNSTSSEKPSIPSDKEGTPDDAPVNSFTESKMTEGQTQLDNTEQQKSNNANINGTNSENSSVNSDNKDNNDEARVNGVTESNFPESAIQLDNAKQQQSNNAEETVTKKDDKQNLGSRQHENPQIDATVGATTSESKNTGGGVSKSTIGMVVAAMVVVVAAITIKKNWSSIKRKFSSSPRPADHAGANGNGTALPEEVPLQDKDKSPV